MARLTEKGAAVFKKLVGLLSVENAADDLDLRDPERLSFTIAGFEGFGTREKQAYLRL
jgi:hypothetical protein